AGAGLDGGPEARRERVLEPERGAAALAVGENVGDEKRRRGLEDASALFGWLVGPEAERTPQPARGEGPVCADELPRAHIGAAQREGGPVEAGITIEAGESEPVQPGEERVAADEAERADGRRVERGGKRGAHGDEPAEAVVVVVRTVEPAWQHH